DDRTGAGVVDPFEALTRAGAASKRAPASAAGGPVVALARPSAGLSPAGGRGVGWSAGVVGAVAGRLCAVAAPRRGRTRRWAGLRRAAARRWRAGAVRAGRGRRTVTPKTTLD